MESLSFKGKHEVRVDPELGRQPSEQCLLHITKDMSSDPWNLCQSMDAEGI